MTRDEMYSKLADVVRDYLDTHDETRGQARCEVIGTLECVKIDANRHWLAQFEDDGK